MLADTEIEFVGEGSDIESVMVSWIVTSPFKFNQVHRVVKFSSEMFKLRICLRLEFNEIEFSKDSKGNKLRTKSRHDSLSV